MKGIIIYEDYRGKEVVEAIKLGMVNYECKSDTSDGSWINNLSGVRKESTQARCNKDDTYDFEIGALISLMKMCGAKKSAEACCEAFPHETSGSIYRENKRYIKRIKELEEKNEALKKEKEQIIVAKNVLYNKLEKENEKLQHEYDLCKNSENALKCSVDYLNKSIAKLNTAIYGYKEDLNKVAERCKELEEENEKLKLDCEKLQHGYIDTDMIFCGGRQNGKQYTLLVDLFKKIPQNKVDEAYKEAYNTKLPVWQREFLKEALSIYKPPTKREQMWNDIISCGDCEHSKYVEVKKEDLQTFVKECNEKKIFNIIGYEFCPRGDWFYDDRCIFQIFRKPAGFICAKRVGFASEDAIIDYLPPMRWDLFEKGRKIVRVTPENIDEFIVKCTNKFGSIMKPVLKRYKDFTHIFVMISDYHYDNKPTIHIMTPEDLVRNQHENPKKYSDKKIVDWEDVR